MKIVDVNSNPCNGCDKRNETCHSTCKEYIKWSKERREYVEEIRKKKLGNNLNRCRMRDLYEKRRKDHR